MKVSIPQVVGVVCGAMFVIVVLQATIPPSVPVPPPPQEPDTDCIGAAIVYDQPYKGWSEPHTCAVQCEDDQPRYILYTDGKATQCETPPGCNDTGEDRGILCRPPLSTTNG